MNKFTKADGGMKGHEISFEELEKIVKNPELVHYAGSIFPPVPGVNLFGAALEYEHFEPDTKKNEDIGAVFIEIGREAVWSMVSIPKKFTNIAQQVANEHGVIITPSPESIATSKGSVNFPIQGPTVHGLTYLQGHYPGLVFPADIGKIMAKEEVQISLILLRTGHAKLVLIESVSS